MLFFHATATEYIALFASKRCVDGSVSGFVVISVLNISFNAWVSSLFGHFLVKVVCVLSLHVPGPCFVICRKIILAFSARVAYLSGKWGSCVVLVVMLFLSFRDVGLSWGLLVIVRPNTNSSLFGLLCY